MYLIAIVCPPLAVLMCGKPFQAILCLFLSLVWLPGAIHACMVVTAYKADQRNEKLVSAMRR